MANARAFSLTSREVKTKLKKSSRQHPSRRSLSSYSVSLSLQFYVCVSLSLPVLSLSLSFRVSALIKNIGLEIFAHDA